MSVGRVWLWPGSRCHRPDISWWPPRPPWRCSRACSSRGLGIWSWCTPRWPGRGLRTGASHTTGGSRWGQGRTWGIIRGQLEVSSPASHYHMAVLLCCRHLLWENPPPPDPWDPRKPGLHLMLENITMLAFSQSAPVWQHRGHIKEFLVQGRVVGRIAHDGRRPAEVGRTGGSLRA